MVTLPSADPRLLLRSGPMGHAQVLAVAICVLVNMMDGFDILASGFTAPAIGAAWRLSHAQLGLFLSSGLAGMTIGALFLSPLADIWGRRRTILAGLGLVGAGMLASMAAPDLYVLLGARVITGAGVAAIMATINTVAAEYASDRRRDLVVCLQATGFPLGGALGAFGVYAAAEANWRTVFAAGAAIAAVLIPLVAFGLPESYDFLLAAQPAGALERLNRLSRRMGLPQLATLPPKLSAGVGARLHERLRAPARELASPGTGLICASFFLLMFAFYFLTSWTPKLLTDFGFSARLGVSGAAFMNLGGVAGDLVFVALMLRRPARKIGPLFLLGAFLATAAIAFAPLRLDTLLPLTFILGFLLFGGMASLYAVVPSVFSANLRASGTGLALGVGRMGATLGPYVGGLLISLAWSRPQYLLVMASPLIVCVVTLLLLMKPYPVRVATAAGGV